MVGPGSSPATTAAVTTTPTDDPLAGFPKRVIRVGDEWWRVAVASSLEERAQGLMGVTDLGSVDGMLFVFPADTTSGFWMKDTLIPLDIAFFDSERRLRTVFDSQRNPHTVFTMEPCLEEPCRVYSPGISYRYALETLPGRMSEFPEGTVLDLR